MKPGPPPEEFALKETSPAIAAGAGVVGDKLTSTYDLVEQMQYLYVRVVKAKDLPSKDATGGCDPYVEVRLGNYRGTTRHFEKNTKPEWNQVFAFAKERIQASIVEIVVKDKDAIKDDFIGRVIFDLNEVPKRVPPDSPLAPQWYMLEDRKGDKAKGELMLAAWMGTQADEAFSEAWHSDAASVSGDAVAKIRSKVYLSPKLWYLRVNVIEAQDLVPNDKTRFPECYVKVMLGNQAFRTKICPPKTLNPMWNEDLLFVAAEPFEEPLVLTVEDRIGPGKDDTLGGCVIPLNSVQRRFDHKPVNSRWYNLEKHVIVDGEKKETKFASRIHLRICLEGGYHVLDESTHYSSDLRPTAKQLWKPSIGILELGILSAHGLMPMKTKDGRGTTDAYCVAKYGQKWVRTRTIIDSFHPKWNEQYTWEVFDPCTVITIGVFDNCHLHGNSAMRDSRIGKVRVRLSTLEADRVYTHSYPLIVLHPSGVKKMGEVQLAVRFSCSSWFNMLHMYSQPLLPKMHYVHPLSVTQVDSLRHQATQIVSMRLSRAEPPLRKEIVEYMLDVDSHMWSMRRSKANFFRIMNVLSIWHYRWRPRHPPHMDTRLSHADIAHPDELDEEFDSFPTSRGNDIIRMRYDRLRSIAGRIQTVVGDLATQGERFQSLLSWRDPRASALFVTFCLVAAIVLYITPFKVVALFFGIYILRHPRFRQRLPSVPINFFRRLPARTDSML
ncbi:hypothetical protein Cgig2_000113 [Carnegiea gigantea]|uniref:C2 domain-containing protein n=1 Tax=Carnegiea gigantea TaxID=171969 RepID=A0A9Q1KZI0_9CARY|nr:hypothetical protein Cgig2_000113 [Carnegiea gigantea]